MNDLQTLLVCPICRGSLSVSAVAARCRSCSKIYPVEDGIVVFTADNDDHQKRRQATWFDTEDDPLWEIHRPSGAPAFYRFLLEEKFRRGTVGIGALIDNSTALVVCGGSGMDAEFLSRAGSRVISSDISLGAAHRACERRQRHNVPFEVIVADAERLPFANASVDLVYVHDGLHHLERPLAGLAEMARVARRAVCVTEPARAAVTRLAVHFGLALDYEEAGNRVARLTLDAVRSTLAGHGFSVITAERYAMYYRHKPGRTARLLSAPVILPLGTLGFRLANSAIGAWLGNKLAIVATRQ